MTNVIDRESYASMFGPTCGDKVRLADTDLFIEIEDDKTTYGEEVKFGGGKVIRDGMGQSQLSRSEGAVDTVITNALIVDYWGIIKADIGIKDGKIFSIGKAGNPDIQDGVDIIIGPGTEAIAGEGRIVTPGGIDAYSLDMSSTNRSCSIFGHNNHAWRRNWSCRRNKCNYLYSWSLAFRKNASSCRRFTNKSCFFW